VYASEYQASNIFFNITVNIGAFYIVAFLSSFPSEQARVSKAELKEKEDDISKLEALNEWIISSMTSGLVTVDGQRNIILFNPAAEKIFEIQAVDVIGKKIAKIFPFIDRYLDETYDDGYSELVKPHGFIDIEHKKSDDQSLSLRFFMSPLQIPDTNQRGNILLFQDVTEMKEIEKEMKRVEGLALIGELAAGIAHEIRNPMASISGSIQMLNEGLETDEVSGRLMDIILRETDRLNRLINDFLKYARPKSLEYSKFNINHVIIESLELLKNSGKWNDGIDVKTELDENAVLVSDPEQVKQVLWNIFLNAVDAIPDKGTLFISTKNMNQHSKKTESELIEIIVRDSGNGFSEKSLSHLFTPFFTTKKGGSGLGLAIVKRIIESLKGEIYGRNHPDGGAEVKILLESNTYHQ
jgi:two-component system sensor histidine kinase PilS (NtrC family)